MSYAGEPMPASMSDDRRELHERLQRWREEDRHAALAPALERIEALHADVRKLIDLLQQTES